MSRLHTVLLQELPPQARQRGTSPQRRQGAAAGGGEATARCGGTEAAFKGGGQRGMFPAGRKGQETSLGLLTEAGRGELEVRRTREEGGQ